MRVLEASPDFITESVTRGHCPDCGHRGFVIGPMGGMSINIECGSLDCRSRFSAAFYGGRAMFCERIDRFGEGGTVWPSEP